MQRQGSRPSSKGRYSRLEADINSMQRDSATYCDEPADTADYQAWRAKFDLAVYKPAVEGLITENAFMAELQARIVPVIVEYDAFWTRYFYRLHLLEVSKQLPCIVSLLFWEAAVHCTVFTEQRLKQTRLVTSSTTFNCTNCRCSHSIKLKHCIVQSAFVACMTFLSASHQAGTDIAASQRLLTGVSWLCCCIILHMPSKGLLLNPWLPCVILRHRSVSSSVTCSSIKCKGLCRPAMRKGSRSLSVPASHSKKKS